MNHDIFIAILATAVTAGTPILYAALGEILTERAGILNLGVEGMMLVGAVCGFIIALNTANPWYGILIAMLAGGAVALIHALLTITLKANQVVSGLALTMFGTGLSGYIGKSYVGMPLPAPFHKIALPGLSNIPVIGPVFFNQDPMVYLSYILVAALWFLTFKTRSGLHLRAVGENPAAADSMGVNAFQIRYIYVVIGGMLAGIGGAYLSLYYVPSWMENITAGRGWIAVALVIFATWNPVNALWGSYLFGGIDALGFRLQTLNVNVSPYFLKMLPYIFTVVVLVLVTKRNMVKRIGSPQALGLPYDREER
ncbi:ABC transporter permease [Desulfotruncus alcoholivorax]|uniref:ABC transporter permease n=1 Tax=Desulfotruncus alcoholivorax TaxID=265477 RepID=UPI00040D2121|nr:ABC transporter permease [Desulfotruncus alcoholivorax]